MQPQSKPVRRSVVSFCLCALFALALQARAASHDISMTADGYQPAYLEVVIGDRVYWWNDDYDYFDYHSTRSYTYPWSSGPVQVGYGVYLDTAKTGTYDYTDDWGYSGWGTLVIKPNTPPEPPPPPTLSGAMRLADGTFQCTIGNLVAGKTFYVQASADLTNWNGIYTGVASGTTETYVDPEAVAVDRRFYRVQALP